MKITTVDESKRREAVELQNRLLKQADEIDQGIHERNERTDAGQSDKKNHAVQEQRCFNARKHLTLLQKELPIYIDEQGRYRPKWKYDTYKGNRKYLEDKSRSHEMKSAQKKVEKFCANPNDAEALEKTNIYWQREEWCSAAKADLEAVQRPEARSTQYELDRYRKRVATSCAK